MYLAIVILDVLYITDWQKKLIVAFFSFNYTLSPTLVLAVFTFD